MQKLPVPNITLETQDQGSVFQSKMNSLASACKTAVGSFNEQIDAAQTAQQYSEAAQQALADADVTQILRRLDMLGDIPKTLRLDFANADYRIYVPGQGLVSKALPDILTNSRLGDATYFGPMGIATAGPNAIRIEHDPLTRKPVGLLHEESRTNESLSCNDLTGMTAARVVTELVNVPSPFSAVSTKITNSVAGDGYLRKSQTMVAGNVYCMSIAINPATKKTYQILAQTDWASGEYVRYNAATDEFSASENSVAYGIEKFPDGWVRIWMSALCVTTYTGINAVVFPRMLSGQPGDYFYAAALNIEKGAYPTSHIETTTSQLTRQADGYSMSIAAVSLPKQGTIFFEGKLPEKNSRFLALTDTSSVNRITMLRVSNGNLGAFIIANNNTAGNITSVPSTGEKLRFAIAYDEQSVTLSINGVSYATAFGEALTGALTKLDIGSENSVKTGRTIIGAVAYSPVKVDSNTLNMVTRV